jgi:alcohol dehydrogenase class IV
MSEFTTAQDLIHEFKGDHYVFGPGVLHQVGRLTAELGTQAALVHGSSRGSEALIPRVEDALADSGVRLLGKIAGAAPNTPREDIRRIANELGALNPDVIVSLGGGSTLDATKAAEVLNTLGGPIDDYLGVGKVTQRLQVSGKTLRPVMAIQTAASSAAHLTKYANVTDVHTSQKKLIVDLAIVPARALFDYDVTVSMPPSFTSDGAWDGMSHALEVLYDSMGKPYHARMMQLAREVIRLAVAYVERAVQQPTDLEARTALGLATDLGGYAIMLGGTNGAHLTSFSLVDILSHGRACAIMNPYYAVFFAPAIQEPLHMIGRVFQDAGLTQADMDRLSGRDLGIAVAQAMMALSKRIQFPTRLSEVPRFSDVHIERALTAAKDPQLRMKLENMPVPLTAEMVDEYMRPVLEAARDGDLSRIRNVA